MERDGERDHGERGGERNGEREKNIFRGRGSGETERDGMERGEI